MSKTFDNKRQNLSIGIETCNSFAQHFWVHNKFPLSTTHCFSLRSKGVREGFIGGKLLFFDKN